jgi:hypothetical protein
MYVQYFCRKPQRQAAAVDVWRRAHGRHLRDDAGRREGWLNMFVRNGWDVYVSDAVERSRQLCVSDV